MIGPTKSEMEYIIGTVALGIDGIILHLGVAFVKNMLIN